jgi:hypothetical protein
MKKVGGPHQILIPSPFFSLALTAALLPLSCAAPTALVELPGRSASESPSNPSTPSLAASSPPWPPPLEPSLAASSPPWPPRALPGRRSWSPPWPSLLEPSLAATPGALPGRLEPSLAAAPGALPGRLVLLLQMPRRGLCRRWPPRFFSFHSQHNGASQKWLASSAIFGGMSSTTNWRYIPRIWLSTTTPTP